MNPEGKVSVLYRYWSSCLFLLCAAMQIIRLLHMCIQQTLPDLLPMTGFEYRGTILPNPWDNLGNNNHHSIVEYQGQWYIFYHNRAVSNAVYQCSVCVDYLYYNSDGTIQTVNATQEGVNPGVTSNPQ